MNELPERITSKFVVAADGCWVWQKSITGGGYGYINWQRKTQKAVRLIYEMLVAPIPAGLQLDHLCRNRACVNPYHVEPVTSRENTMRGKSIIAKYAKQTSCKNGHEYTSENTYIRPDGSRFCRACNRERMRLNWRRYKKLTT